MAKPRNSRRRVMDIVSKTITARHESTNDDEAAADDPDAEAMRRIGQSRDLLHAARAQLRKSKRADRDDLAEIISIAFNRLGDVEWALRHHGKS